MHTVSTLQQCTVGDSHVWLWHSEQRTNSYHSTASRRPWQWLLVHLPTELQPGASSLPGRLQTKPAVLFELRPSSRDSSPRRAAKSSCLQQNVSNPKQPCMRCNSSHTVWADCCNGESVHGSQGVTWHIGARSCLALSRFTCSFLECSFLSNVLYLS